MWSDFVVLGVADALVVTAEAFGRHNDFKGAKPFTAVFTPTATRASVFSRGTRFSDGEVVGTAMWAIHAWLLVVVFKVVV